MEAIITAVFLILIFLCWVLTILGGLGTLLILLFSAIYSFLTHFEIIGPRVLLALLLIYLSGEIFDYLFIFLSGRIFGASKKASLGAILGGFIGAGLSFVGLGIGILPLTLWGIFLGALSVELREKKDIFKALSAGIASLFGKISTSLFKIFLGLLMILLLLREILNYLK
jgi:uncharacterized protein YqgC (DUF456 family)